MCANARNLVTKTINTPDWNHNALSSWRPFLLSILPSPSYDIISLDMEDLWTRRFLHYLFHCMEQAYLKYVENRPTIFRIAISGLYCEHWITYCKSSQTLKESTTGVVQYLHCRASSETWLAKSRLCWISSCHNSADSSSDFYICFQN